MRRLILPLSIIAMLLGAPAAWSRTSPVTAEALRSEPELPAEFGAMAHAQRLEWLQRQLDSTDDPVARYRWRSEQAEAHFRSGDYTLMLAICDASPPQPFHLRYRLTCLSSDEVDPASTINALFDLHLDALGAGDVDLAAQALSIAAWRQSDSGDIRGAFDTYGQAMALAEKTSIDVLNDISVNTATLYAMHGDPEYVQKGVALQQAAIERFRTLAGEHPDRAAIYHLGIAISQYNAGIAYALHLDDHARALHWFGQIDPTLVELRASTLVFSALSAAELGRDAQARAWLAQSRTAPPAPGVDTDYLACYQALVQLKLDGRSDIAPCRTLSSRTSLEVSLDIHKRLSAMPQSEWRLLGLEGLHHLFIETLEPQLKQSSARAASNTELSRLELESKLKDQLLEKEQALKRAEQDKLVNQRLLAGAIGAILLLVIALILLRLRSNRKMARQFLSLSLHDGLTGLHNRRYFEHNIAREISQIRRAQQDGSHRALAICLLDIDHFKHINDSRGHDAGDAVLAEFARRLKVTTRESDMLVRWGGEEFLLLAWLAEPQEIHVLTERIRSAVAGRSFKVRGGRSLEVTCTIGAALYPRVPGEVVDVDWPWLLQLADAALYLGKRRRRNCWVSVDNVADPRSLDAPGEHDLEALAREGRLVLTHSMGDQPGT